MAFDGCELLDHLDSEDADFDKAVEPVLPSRDLSGRASTTRSSGHCGTAPWPGAIHDEAAEVVLSPDSFRPYVPWTSDRDDYVIVARDSEANWVGVTWSLTEDGNDAVTTGELQAPTEELVDASDLFRKVCFSGD